MIKRRIMALVLSGQRLRRRLWRSTRPLPGAAAASAVSTAADMAAVPRRLRRRRRLARGRISWLRRHVACGWLSCRRRLGRRLWLSRSCCGQQLLRRRLLRLRGAAVGLAAAGASAMAPISRPCRRTAATVSSTGEPITFAATPGSILNTEPMASIIRSFRHSDGAWSAPSIPVVRAHSPCFKPASQMQPCKRTMS